MVAQGSEHGWSGSRAEPILKRRQYRNVWNILTSIYLSSTINLELPERWVSRQRVHSLVINKSYEPQILKDESHFNPASTLLNNLGIKSYYFWTCRTPPSLHRPHGMLIPDLNGTQVEFIRRYSLDPS